MELTSGDGRSQGDLKARPIEAEPLKSVIGKTQLTALARFNGRAYAVTQTPEGEEIRLLKKLDTAPMRGATAQVIYLRMANVRHPR